MSLMTSTVAIKARHIGRALGLNRLLAGLLRGKNYEEKFSSMMLGAVRNGDCVWDIGANVGFYATKFIERTGDGGCVVCFEPSPINTTKLVEATKGIANLTVQQVALGAASGRVSFSQGLDELGATSRVLASGERQSADVIEVDVVRGDDLVSAGSIPLPNILKIDTEGFEFDVLIGLQDTIKLPSVRAVFVEVHFGLLEGRGQSDAPGQIEKMLENSGFRCTWPDASHLAAFRLPLWKG